MRDVSNPPRTEALHHEAAMTDKEIADINDSWELALLCHGIPLQEVHELRQTVEDAITNNMG